MASRSATTVLLPLCNGARFVREAVRSVLEQGHGDFELLVPDDVSSDAGPDIVQGMSNRRLRFSKHPDH